MDHNPHHHQHMPPIIPTPFGSCPPPPQPGNVQYVPVPVYPTPGGCQPPPSVFPDQHHQHHDQHFDPHHQHFDPHHDQHHQHFDHHHPDPHHHGHH